MDEVFFSEPGRTRYEIRDGLVFITSYSGTRRFQRCTTIAAFKRELRKGQKLVTEFDTRQRKVVARLG